MPEAPLSEPASDNRATAATDGRLRVVIATPLADDLIAEIASREPRLDIIVDQSLLPPQRHPGDHAGDPDFRRTDAQQAAYEAMVDSADALYGIPDERPTSLRRAVDANPGLRWVQTMPAGGGAQIKAARLSDEQLDRIAFSTTAGVHAEPLAEFSLFGLLAGFKNLPDLQRHQRDHDWAASRWIMGTLSSKRVLIVGLGSIGRVTAAKLAALGMDVAGTSRRDVTVDGVTEVIHPSELEARIGDFDGIVVTLPGTEQTDKLVSAAVLAAVKPGAVIVNVGRGTVIDEEALVEQLRREHVGFAALDVVAKEPLAATSPLWDLPNVLISPHTAALNEREDLLIARLFARNATRFLDGRDLINRVDTVEFY